MQFLVDRNNIIENNLQDANSDELSSLLDNYLENLLHSDEKIFHSDLLNKIIESDKVKDIQAKIVKHLDNFLKQKKIAIRSSIKRGNFKIDDLLNISIYYRAKVCSFSDILKENEKLDMLKISSLQLFDNIISETHIIPFLKSRLGNILEEDEMTMRNLINLICAINSNNPDTLCYKWFYLLFSNAIKENIEDICSRIYPVPEEYNTLLVIISGFNYFQKVIKYLNKIRASVNLILYESINIFYVAMSKMFKNNSLKEINTILKNHSYILALLTNIKDGDSMHQESILRIEITKDVLNLVNKNNVNIDELLECVSTILPYMSNNMNRDIIFKKLNSILLSDNILDNIELSVAIKMFSYLKEKDKFIEIYNKKLVQRILNKPDFKTEYINYNSLKEVFSDKLLFKTKKIITDAENTSFDLSNFKDLNMPDIRNKDKLNLITTSYNWDFNQNEGFYSVLNDKNKIYSDIYILMNIYDLFYKERYENKRKINWYLHFGEIVFTYKETDFKMMPLQFMVLEFVKKWPNTNKDELLELSIFENYNEDFKKSIISSLIFGGFLKFENNHVSMNTDISTTTDYIKLFFSTTNYGDIWEENRQIAFKLSREEILSSNINHFVKVKPVNKDELFKIITDKLTIFTPEKNMFDTVLEKMVENEYIKIEEEMVIKLFY